MNGHAFSQLWVKFGLKAGTFAPVTDYLATINMTELLAMDASDIGVYQDSRLSFSADGNETYQYVNFAVNDISVTEIADPPEVVLTILPSHVLRFQSEDSVIYFLESSEDLSDWDPTGATLVGDGGTMEFAVEKTKPAEYYRVNRN